jgi:hypothetical protein
MLEQGVPGETVKGIMGWVSERMINTYSHTRLAAKQGALAVLEKVGRDGGEEAPAKGKWMPAMPLPPQPDVQAELAQLRQLVEQLQAQVASRTPGEAIYREIPAPARGGLLHFPHKPA